MAGESARRKAQSARDEADRLLAVAEKWEKGAVGEATTGAVLDALGPGWVIRHDLRWPGRARANIDHLVVGPTGIFVIDTKNWSGKITVRDDVLRQNGYRREPAVDGCDESALAIGRLVPEFMQTCRPVLCFVRDEPMRGQVRGVDYCSTATLVETLTRRPPVLTPDQIARVAGVLRESVVGKDAAQTTRVRTTKPRPPQRKRSDRRRRGPSTGARLARLVLAAGVILVGVQALPSASQWVAEWITVQATTP